MIYFYSYFLLEGSKKFTSSCQTINILRIYMIKILSPLLQKYSTSPFSHFLDYAALLSRHSSLSPTTSTAIATGRFYFRKKTLSYSFVTSPDFGFPTFLTFLDEQSNIIEEFPLRQTHFQVRTLIHTGKLMMRKNPKNIVHVILKSRILIY